MTNDFTIFTNSLRSCLLFCFAFFRILFPHFSAFPLQSLFLGAIHIYTTKSASLPIRFHPHRYCVHYAPSPGIPLRSRSNDASDPIPSHPFSSHPSLFARYLKISSSHSRSEIRFPYVFISSPSYAFETPGYTLYHFFPSNRFYPIRCHPQGILCHSFLSLFASLSSWLLSNMHWLASFLCTVHTYSHPLYMNASHPFPPYIHASHPIAFPWLLQIAWERTSPCIPSCWEGGRASIEKYF